MKTLKSKFDPFNIYGFIVQDAFMHNIKSNK